MKKTQKTELPVGDGNARASVTRGFKTWFSTREAGLTIESTVNVSIVCGQTEKEIEEATSEAGRIGEKCAVNGLEEMDLHLNSFVKEVSG